ncbi:MAG TPA: hypothetical protein VHM70_19145 [Polyangiaceae bacterium]|jgi:hypothetical protein|nr:hypothetical protein [Polyangiaceae bacterium]
MPSTPSSTSRASLLRFVRHINQVHAAISRACGNASEVRPLDQPPSSSPHAGTSIVGTPVASFATMELTSHNLETCNQQRSE